MRSWWGSGFVTKQYTSFCIILNFYRIKVSEAESRYSINSCKIYLIVMGSWWRIFYRINLLSVLTSSILRWAFESFRNLLFHVWLTLLNIERPFFFVGLSTAVRHTIPNFVFFLFHCLVICHCNCVPKGCQINLFIFFFLQINYVPVLSGNLSHQR